ncbi:fimbrial protein [Pseudomonas sp. S9]|uniref:fimbrial protein n=1 Tax=Pseudomonas sp. S9 TaxID=686578 RepID=UPI0002F4356A|nr:fimbrial protein [Pseudomonas sp. S9]
MTSRHMAGQGDCHAPYALKHIHLKYLAVLIVALFLPFVLGTAQAQCKFINGFSVENKYLVPNSGVIASTNTAIGTPIGAYSERPKSLSANYANCTSPGTASRTVAGTLLSSEPYTYATDNPSVGIRFFDDSAAYGRRYWGGGAAESKTGNWSWIDGRIGAELIALGPLQTTRINSSAVATFSLDGLVIMTVRVASVTISVQTCKTSDVAVELGAQLVSSFSGPGSTTPAKAFNIELTSCPPGADGIFYQLDPLTAILPESGQSVVALDSSSSATGIGIQLLDGNSSPFALANKTKLAEYDSGRVADYSIPFAARYYQTASKVTTGTANTALIFTITYH